MAAQRNHIDVLSLGHVEDDARDWVGGFDRLISRLIQESILEETHTPGLLRVLRGAAEGERYLRRLSARAQGLLAEPLRDAKAAGIVRADLQLEDVQVLFAMMEGAIEEADISGRPRIALRALELIFLGVAERGKWSPARMSASFKSMR